MRTAAQVNSPVIKYVRHILCILKRKELPPLKHCGTKQHNHSVNIRQHIHSRLIKKVSKIRDKTMP